MNQIHSVKTNKIHHKNLFKSSQQESRSSDERGGTEKMCYDQSLTTPAVFLLPHLFLVKPVDHNKFW